MLQKFETQTSIQMRALNDSRKISKCDLGVINELRYPYIWPKGRERIVSYLRESARDLSVKSECLE